MRKILISGAISLVVSFLLISCEAATGIVMDMPPSAWEEPPPFVITKPVFEITERPFYFNYAGVSFQFFNQTETIVNRITVSFLLYDPRSRDNPFIGSNKFEITKQELVFQNENKEILLSLDRFIHIAPTEPYLIDFFYIYEIQYVDGSVWQDKYGRFRVRS